MQINMTTFANRKEHYIQETMRSLFDSDWQGSGIVLNLIMGSEDESHVQEYASHPSIRIVPWDIETDPIMRRNCTLNKIRALEFGDDETTITCEDDILFAPTWWASLQEAAAELGDQSYVLSLFSATPFLERENLIEGTTWIKPYPMPVLQGAQGLYYPNRAIRREVAEYLRVNIAKACGDDLIGRCARASAALYATKELLVDHVGQVSCFH